MVVRRGRGPRLGAACSRRRCWTSTPRLGRARAARKPNLAVIAQQLGISFTRIEHPDEEARVISLVLPRLLDMAEARGTTTLGAFAVGCAPDDALRRCAAPPPPGAARTARHVRPARRRAGRGVRWQGASTALAYGGVRAPPVGRHAPPRRTGRRGRAVESALCATDLEALILEDREIRRLQPRFNTQRRQRAPRTWLRLPTRLLESLGHTRSASSACATRARAIPRVRRRSVRWAVSKPDGGRAARWLARAVFDLDHGRRAARRTLCRVDDPSVVVPERRTEAAMQRVRHRHASAVAMADHTPPATGRACWLPCATMIRARCCCPPTRASLATPSSVRRPWASKDLSSSVPSWSARILVNLEAADFLDFASQILRAERAAHRAADIDVVLRWFGAQRPPARLVHLDDGTQIATERLAAAAMALGAELLAGRRPISQSNEGAQ